MKCELSFFILTVHLTAAVHSSLVMLSFTLSRLSEQFQLPHIHEFRADWHLSACIQDNQKAIGEEDKKKDDELERQTLLAEQRREEERLLREEQQREKMEKIKAVEGKTDNHEGMDY